MPKLTKLILSATIILLAANIASGQWTCRSKMAAFAKPIYANSPVYWSSEITLGEGVIEDRAIFNVLAFLGLDYIRGNHRLYTEAGWKMWRTSEDGYTYDKNRFGPRELFYSYNTSSSMLIAGFHTMTFGDNFLVNEKATGISINHSFAKYTVNTRIASVDKDYSRFGTFCDVRYLYDVIPGRQLSLPGDSFGETNFGGVVLSWKPSRKVIPKITEAAIAEDDTDNGSDEFEEFQETDEFEEFGDFEEIEKPKAKAKNKLGFIDEIGFVFCSEFGSEIDDPEYYPGAMVNIKLSNDIKLNTEMLYQSIKDQSALIYSISGDYAHIWRSGSMTNLTATYYGKSAIDDNARAQISNANLFVGEVARLDAIDMPLVQLAFKHNFPPIQTQIKLQYARQLDYDNIDEFNIAIGKTFYKHVKLTGMYSLLNADTLPESYQMFRLEMRATF